ncbi:MAG: chemotaxis protein CheX [Bryobacteraceae bacterium]
MIETNGSSAAPAVLEDLIAGAIRKATNEVFTTMMGLEVSAGPERKGGLGITAGRDVMAFIGLAGSWIGTGTVCCNAAAACRMSTRFLMSELDSVNGDVLDAVGEITNMILGNVKSMLENHLGQLCLSVPTVVYGKNFEARAFNGSESISVPFQIGEDHFEVSLALRRHMRRAGLRNGFPIEEQFLLASARDRR